LDYHDMYFELFRVQANTIDALEEIVDKLKIAHLAVEAMLLNQDDDSETP